MAEELNLEDGVNETIRRIEQVEERPVLVAVYGWPNSGKTYFMERIADYFKNAGNNTGLEAVKGSCGPNEGAFEMIRDRSKRDCIYMFHCGWEREDFTDGTNIYFTKHEDPNFLAESILKRRIHLNIWIYNPHTRRKPERLYDLIISNPDSVGKPLIR